MKQKICIFNDSPSDVFSTHLLGKESLEVIRMRILDNDVLGKTDLILTVNHRLALAEKLKSAHPDVRVAAVSGGEKDFQPIITLVYGKNDYDELTYGNWEEFEKLLLFEQPRQPKYLVHKRDTLANESIYEPNLSLLNVFEPAPRDEFVSFLKVSTQLSASYLNWYVSWIKEIQEMSFPLTSRPQKRASQLTFSFINEHRGLPIFSIGDGVTLLDKNENRIGFQHDEYPINVSIFQAAPDGVTIKFSKPVSLSQLHRLYKIRLDSFIMAQRISRMNACLETFLDNFVRSVFVKGTDTLSHPASFLCFSVAVFLRRQSINYPTEIALSSATKKILRDPSQVLALMDMLGDKPISNIVGPAGTGKTFVAAVGVDNFVRRRCNVLLISHSNLGVDNLLLEVAQYVDKASLCRLGNDPEVVAEKARPFLRQGIRTTRRPNYLDDLPDKTDDFVKYQQGAVVACTIDGFLMSKELREGYFKPDVIFCDEASRGFFAELAPLFLAASQKVILIGDNKQLGNIPVPLPLIEHFKSAGYSQTEINQFGNGFFNSLIDNQYLVTSMLRQNRRSLPRISELVNHVFYDGKLIPGRFNPYNEGMVMFLDTKEIEGAMEKREGTSWHNPLESNLLAKRFVSLAAKNVKAGGKIEDLVIITPYMAQVKLLKKKLRNHLLYHEAFIGQTKPENIDDILDKAVITVDAIQGGQRKIVFVSLVRANARQDIGFNKDIRRINVAMSRAQESLIIIGNSQTFTECDSALISSAFLHILQLAKKYKKYFVLN